jgi:hypothetical protein
MPKYVTAVTFPVQGELPWAVVWQANVFVITQGRSAARFIDRTRQAAANLWKV